MIAARQDQVKPDFFNSSPTEWIEVNEHVICSHSIFINDQWFFMLILLVLSKGNFGFMSLCPQIVSCSFLTEKMFLNPCFAVFRATEVQRLSPSVRYNLVVQDQAYLWLEEKTLDDILNWKWRLKWVLKKRIMVSNDSMRIFLKNI